MIDVAITTLIGPDSQSDWADANFQTTPLMTHFVDQMLTFSDESKPRGSSFAHTVRNNWSAISNSQVTAADSANAFHFRRILGSSQIGWSRRNHTYLPSCPRMAPLGSSVVWTLT
jgi:hypothetical protein